jgi:hypothetical protein
MSKKPGFILDWVIIREIGDSAFCTGFVQEALTHISSLINEEKAFFAENTKLMVNFA